MPGFGAMAGIRASVNTSRFRRNVFRNENPMCPFLDVWDVVDKRNPETDLIPRFPIAGKKLKGPFPIVGRNLRSNFQNTL